MIPDAPVTAELRAAATERYAQASVEQARVLSRKGDVAGAKAAVDKVLREDVAPDDPGALAMRAQLDDPIRTNPALTQGARRRMSMKSAGCCTRRKALSISGRFDEADARYQDVLRIDATNTAARRGMERVAAARSGYHRAAYDQTRAEMLGRWTRRGKPQCRPPKPIVGPGGTRRPYRCSLAG